MLNLNCIASTDFPSLDFSIQIIAFKTRDAHVRYIANKLPIICPALSCLLLKETS